MTLRETTDIIKEFCANEPNVGFVGVGDVYDLNSNQDVAYPSMVITQQTHSLIIDEEWYRFHFIIFYIDRLTEDKTNENQIQSTAITVLKNLVYNLEGMGIFASFDYTFNTFTERFESLCSGAYVDIQLNVPIADCDWETVFDYLKELFQKEIDGKQDKLISGVNIKTINGETILGSGNIEIQGGEECYTREEIDEKLEVITENVDINAQSILRNADNIIDLQSNKANKEDLDALESVLKALGDDFKVLNGEVSTLEEKSNEIQENVDINAQSILRNADNIVDLQSNKANKEDLDEVRILADRGSNAYNIINSNHLAHIALQDSEEYGEELYLNGKNYSDKWNQAAADAANALERIDKIEQNDYLTKEEADETYATAENLSVVKEATTMLEGKKANKEDLNALGDTINAVSDKVSTLEEKVAEIEQNDYLTKDEGDTYYQPIGDYALKSEIPTDYVGYDTFNTYTAETDAKIAEIEEKGYDDTEVRQLIQGNTVSINSLEGSLTDVIDTVEELSSKVNESVSQSDFDTYTANTEAVLSDKADKSEIPSLDGYATEQWVNDQGYLTEHQSLDDYYTKSEVDEKIPNPNDYYKKVETSDGYIAIYNYEKDDRVIPEIDVKENDEFNYVKIDGRGTVWIASDGTTEQPITADKIIKWDNTSNQKFKTINNESILGEGNIVITGTTPSGAYLPLSGGTLTGHLSLGSGTETSYKKVEVIRNVNSIPNGAAFYVNSDGTAAFFHKTYASSTLSGAVNDAILRFNNEGLFFAKGATNRTTATDFKEVLTTEKAYTKTEIDEMIGNIELLLSKI